MRKHLFFIAFFILSVVAVWGQAPQAFSYQAVVRDEVGKLVSNRDVSISMSIIQGGDKGTVVFFENQRVRTNTHGLFSINVGATTSIADIDWGNGPYFLKVEIDPQGGENYVLSTSQQLISVPYALYAFVADSVRNIELKEKQRLSISNDTIFLTGGSFVKLPDFPNSLADVVGFGNSADDHQLKDLQDPTDPQDAVTLSYLDSIMHNWTLDSTDRGSHNIFVVDACDSYTWYGSVYNANGIYTHAYANGGGYYSVDTLKLTIRYGTYNHDYVTATNSYTWHGTLYTSSGQYLYNYQNAFGCPSTDMLHLTINTSSGADCVSYRMEDDTATVTACGKLNWYGNILRQTGVYQHNLGTIAQGGCDSIVKINLVIKTEYHQDTAVRTTTPIVWRGDTYQTQGDYGDTMQAANGCDSIYTLHLMMGGDDGIGAAPGLFSVSPVKQIRFASGNLQLQSSTNYWQFAKEQYQIIDLGCAASYYPSWADIFRWATSGYHDDNDSLNVYYQPWAHENTPAPEGSFEYQNNQYGYGPSHFMTDTNLVGTSENYDWGMYQPIINGGNGSALWRLPTRDEWEYLLHIRPNADHLSGTATVCGVSGFLILADNWVCPSGVSFSPTGGNYYDQNSWSILEASGAAFLPSNGYAAYWTSTSGSPGSAYALAIGSSVILAPYNRARGYYVRLVQDHKPGVMDCSCTYYDTTIISQGSFDWHGYHYDHSGDFMEALVNSAGCDSIITLSLIIEGSGELDSLFSVAPGKKVKFSRGNLQYKASFNMWRFGVYQYDYVGEFNNYVSSTYNGWIDIFAWATSGYHDSTDMGNTAYHPWSTSGSFGPSRHMSDWNLVNTSAKYDWGVYDTIPNGGNAAGLWRTMTVDEWNYVYSGRPNASALRGWIIVNGVPGVLLLPDNWVCPDSVDFDPYHQGPTQDYDVNEWKWLEDAGAVFLPAGCIYQSDTGVSRSANYWSSTSVYPNNPWSSYAYYFRGYSTDDTGKGSRIHVRLVKDVPTTPTP